jgi:hypothetical protein
MDASLGRIRVLGIEPSDRAKMKRLDREKRSSRLGPRITSIVDNQRQFLHPSFTCYVDDCGIYLAKNNIQATRLLEHASSSQFVLKFGACLFADDAMMRPGIVMTT